MKNEDYVYIKSSQIKMFLDQEVDDNTGCALFALLAIKTRCDLVYRNRQILNASYLLGGLLDLETASPKLVEKRKRQLATGLKILSSPEVNLIEVVYHHAQGADEYDLSKLQVETVDGKFTESVLIRPIEEIKRMVAYDGEGTLSTLLRVYCGIWTSMNHTITLEETNTSCRYAEASYYSLRNRTGVSERVLFQYIKTLIGLGIIQVIRSSRNDSEVRHAPNIYCRFEEAEAIYNYLFAYGEPNRNYYLNDDDCNAVSSNNVRALKMKLRAFEAQIMDTVKVKSRKERYRQSEIVNTLDLAVEDNHLKVAAAASRAKNVPEDERKETVVKLIDISGFIFYFELLAKKSKWIVKDGSGWYTEKYMNPKEQERLKLKFDYGENYNKGTLIDFVNEEGKFQYPSDDCLDSLGIDWVTL